MFLLLQYSDNVVLIFTKTQIKKIKTTSVIGYLNIMEFLFSPKKKKKNDIGYWMFKHR